MDTSILKQPEESGIWQAASEYENFENKPMLPKADPSVCFGVKRSLIWT